MPRARILGRTANSRTAFPEELVVHGNHNHPRRGIDYNEPPLSFICLGSLRTLLALPSMDEDNLWRRSHEQKIREEH